MTDYWLVKSEPGSFSIADLAAAPKQTTFWDGVRNYQARNFMRQMRVGDEVLFYHSVKDPAIVGLTRVVREAYPDFTAWDPSSDHYDPRSIPDKPLWDMVDLRLERILPRHLPLAFLRTIPALADMELLRKGSRLSVQPVTSTEFETILRLAESEVPCGLSD
ncbi:MAG: EVE domain-containing protein [Deltaproteobacteria bacterium]|nr:EVE domain-containing protein [Deltaproteobacteria bacterium]